MVRTPVIRRPSVVRPQVVRDKDVTPQPQLTDSRIRIPNDHKQAPDGGNCCQSDFPGKNKIKSAFNLILSSLN